MLTARGEVATKESLNRERHMVATINQAFKQEEYVRSSHVGFGI